MKPHGLKPTKLNYITPPYGTKLVNRAHEKQAAIEEMAETVNRYEDSPPPPVHSIVQLLRSNAELGHGPLTVADVEMLEAVLRTNAVLVEALRAVRNTDDHAAPEVRSLVRTALDLAGYP